MDWIQGQKFWGIADFVFTPKLIAKDDYYKLPNTFSIEKLKLNSIVYTHTQYIPQLFGLLEWFTIGKIIVISHNSDVNVTEDFVSRVPTCVKKWFTTNVNTFNSKIEPIPIGIENDRWFPKLHKKDVMLWRLGEQRGYKNLVYMNHDIQTNLSKRQEPYDLLSDKSWVTTKYGKNGKDFAEYIQNIYEHKFVICPEGNGIDTHRVWETLYMGSIPIVKHDYYSFYDTLPLCIVNKWGELTETSLNLIYDSMQKWKKNDVEELKFEFWKNRILKEIE